ncbi:PilZ domain-containing protein [Paenibacillus sp. NPDC058071]|uniref:PilZ domain-containing protein n=1 Tax=Paenibacillus sp. NPDC058071 TaxID=3346326 RepID=UPI0036D95D25
MAQYSESSLRAHIRMRLNSGIPAAMSLLDGQGRLLTRSSASVLLLNISQEGLCFLTGLKLPVGRHYMVDFKLQLAGNAVYLRGHVVWREKRDHSYEYGISFDPPSKMKETFVRLLNQEMLRQSPEQHRIHQLYRKLSGLRPLAAE